VAKSPAALYGARPGRKCGAVVALRRRVILVLRDRVSLNQWMGHKNLLTFPSVWFMLLDRVVVGKGPRG
jgi:hypothetical protein